jgi:hypothetical protein
LFVANNLQVYKQLNTAVQKNVFLQKYESELKKTGKSMQVRKSFTAESTSFEKAEASTREKFFARLV